MAPTGPTRDDLVTAMLAVFNQGTLAKWLDIQMDVTVANVASGDTFTAVVFNLIKWAERQGRLDEFVTVVARASPDNPVMKNFVAQWVAAGRRFATAVPPADAAAPVPVPVPDAGALRRAIDRAFNSDELDRLCAAVEDELRKQGRNTRVSLDAIGARGKPLESQVLELVRHADRHGYLPILIEVVRRERPGIV